MTADPLAWVRAEMDGAEKVATSATAGPWFADGGTVHAGHPTNEVVNYCGENAPHIARHDPAAVLRRIKAERKMLDKCEWVLNADGWADYDAPGLAEEVISRIAEGWGWIEETT